MKALALPRRQVEVPATAAKSVALHTKVAYAFTSHLLKSISTIKTTG